MSSSSSSSSSLFNVNQGLRITWQFVVPQRNDPRAIHKAGKRQLFRFQSIHWFHTRQDLSLLFICNLIKLMVTGLKGTGNKIFSLLSPCSWCESYLELIMDKSSKCTPMDSQFLPVKFMISSLFSSLTCELVSNLSFEGQSHAIKCFPTFNIWCPLKWSLCLSSLSPFRTVRWCHPQRLHRSMTHSRTHK